MSALISRDSSLRRTPDSRKLGTSNLKATCVVALIMQAGQRDSMWLGWGSHAQQVKRSVELRLKTHAASQQTPLQHVPRQHTP